MSLNYWDQGGSIVLEYLSVIDQVPTLIQKSELVKFQYDEPELMTIKDHAIAELKTIWHHRLCQLITSLSNCTSQGTHLWSTKSCQIALSFMQNEVMNLKRESCRIMEIQDSQDIQGSTCDQKLSQIYEMSSQWFFDALVK